MIMRTRMRIIQTRTVRHGFTLVELLVAMALTLFIMAIISQAFVAGLDTFRGLKAIGDMQEDLRVSMTMLRRDLTEDHFEGGLKLSNPQLSPSNRPKEGYFFIRQVSQVSFTTPGANYEFEGTDADGLPSFRAVDHCLAFTIKLRGNHREDVMMSYDIPTFPESPPAAVKQWSPLSISGPGLIPGATGAYHLNQRRDALHNPGGPPNYPKPYQPDPDIFASQWAEIGYLLVRTGSTDDPANPLAGGTPLYGLYRTQHLLVPNVEEANKLDSDPNKSAQTKGTTLDTFLNGGFYSGVSAYDPDLANPNTQLVFNSPASVADTTIPPGTPSGNITGVLPSTATTPIVVNCGGNHMLTSGMIVVITGVNGIPGANGSFTVTVINPTTFALNGTHGPVGLGNYAGGGAWTWGVTVGIRDRVLSRTAGLNVVNLPRGPGGQPRKAALVCPNIVSFHVQTMPLGETAFRDISAYDTTLVPVPLAGIKITIRVYDFTTRFSRQLSLVQDL
jgi:prepilin-type N-terminal cleavage/methylation domain-containing protein